MSKMTLLDIVQSTLNAMDSDPVNSIGDTVEGAQVAQHARECYFDLLSQRDWPFLRTEFQMEGLADLTHPTTMRLGEDMSKITTVRYNKKEVFWMPPEDFRNLLDQRTVLVGVVNDDGFGLNRDPSYYTTFDDELFVFDSIDKLVDDTLMSSKSRCYGVRVPQWSGVDEFVPDLPEKMFPMFLAEVKSTCFLSIKQQANAKEERRAQRGRMTMQNEAWRNNASETKWNSKINYGRK